MMRPVSRNGAIASRAAGAVALLAEALVAQLARARTSPIVSLRRLRRVRRAVPAPVPGVAARGLDVEGHRGHLLRLSQANLSDQGRPAREICRACWQPSPVGFSVPDAVWQQAVHPRFHNEVLCLACFCRLADERLIPWDDEIEFWPVSAASMTEVPAPGNKHDTGDDA